MRKEIGKIKSISLGYGGYQDVMIGVSVELGGKSWGVGDFKGCWAQWDEHCSWKQSDQIKKWGEAVEFVKNLLDKSGKRELSDLVGVPVEVAFDEQNTLKSWRILDEVL